MDLTVNGKKIVLDVDIPEERLKIAIPPSHKESRSWEEVAIEALDNPLEIPRLEAMDLKGKKICVIVDDRDRPTPVHAFAPEIARRLESGGADDDNITFLTASGMHEPMDRDELKMKLGDGIVEHFRCVSHDAGDKSHLRFCGITDRGTPVWVNSHVVDADFVIAAGRVFPHITHGFEGGYKMICPGVSSFETIIRNHGMNFAANSICGSLEKNISRLETDAVGRIVGIDFDIGFVVTHGGYPVKAFAGKMDPVFDNCVRYGVEQVWGSSLDRLYDVTILAAGKAEENSRSYHPFEYLGSVIPVTKKNGTFIIILDEQISTPGVSDKQVSARGHIVEGEEIDDLEISDLLKLHEKRTWHVSDRQVQVYLKEIRRAFYVKRNLAEINQNLFIVSEKPTTELVENYHAEVFQEVNSALKRAFLKYRNPHVLVIPEGRRTLIVKDF